MITTPWIRVLSLLGLLALSALAPAQVGERTNAPRRAGVPVERTDQARVIVRYRAEGVLMREAALAAGRGEPRLAQAARLSQRHGLPMSDGHAVAPRTQVLHARGLSSSALVERLRADPDVEGAWVDERVRIAAAPNDPRYAGGQTTITPTSGQWYLRAPDSTIVSAINAEAAWDVTPGSAAIVVAVIDTGVRPDHPDLVGKLLPGYDFVSEDSPGDFTSANDGNGRDNDPSDPGDWISAAENASGPLAGCGESPSSWHGTQTSGLVGAATNNAIGMAGAGRNVRIVPVRALGKCGGFQSDVVAAMRWAGGLSNDPVPNPYPARVINLSLGSPGPCAGQPYESAINELVAAGVHVVVSAGNDAGLAASKPANCSGAIGVAGLRHSGTKSLFSSIGPELTIAAPAGNCVDLTIGQCLYPMLTTTNVGTTTPAASAYTDGFDITFGTSFSAPLVAGAVALMVSTNPSLTPAQVRALLRSTARPFPTTGGTPGTLTCRAPDNTEQDECYCTSTTCGAGMLNAAAAVQQAAATRATTALAFATPIAPEPGALVVLDGSTSVAAPSRTIASYEWSTVSSGGIATLQQPTNAATVNVATSGGGTFTMRLKVTDSSGAQASTDISVTVAAATAPSSGGGGGAMSLTWLLGLLLAAAALRRRA